KTGHAVHGGGADRRDAERRGQDGTLRAGRAGADDRIQEAVAEAAGADLIRLAAAAAAGRRRVAIAVRRAAAELLDAAEGVEGAGLAHAVVRRRGIGRVRRADRVGALVGRGREAG